MGKLWAKKHADVAQSYWWLHIGSHRLYSSKSKAFCSANGPTNLSSFPRKNEVCWVIGAQSKVIVLEKVQHELKSPILINPINNSLNKFVIIIMRGNKFHVSK